MSQLSPSQARVIDPILSEVAQGYSNSEFVGMSLFPSVPVSQRGGKILAFDKGAFRLYNTGRAPGQNTKRVQFGYSGSNFTLESHSLEGLVPIENQQEAEAVPGIDLGAAAVLGVQDIIGLRLEKAQADLATAASNYAASNKATLSGTSQWSHASSNPVGDVETGKEAVRAAIGKRPNQIVMGPKVFSALKTNPAILDRIKYTGRDVPTLQLLASLFDVESVLVGDAIYADDSDAFADVWGKFVVLAYTVKGAQQQRGKPTYGYTYRLNGYPEVEEPYYDNNSKSWIYPVTDEVAPVIAGASAGYLISAAVA